MCNIYILNILTHIYIYIYINNILIYVYIHSGWSDNECLGKLAYIWLTIYGSMVV